MWWCVLYHSLTHICSFLCMVHARTTSVTSAGHYCCSVEKVTTFKWVAASNKCIFETGYGITFRSPKWYCLSNCSENVPGLKRFFRTRSHLLCQLYVLYVVQASVPRKATYIYIYIAILTEGFFFNISEVFTSSDLQKGNGHGMNGFLRVKSNQRYSH